MEQEARTFEAVDKDEVAWLGTGPVPAAPYHDPEWFELEREAVFRRSWLPVGHVCELDRTGSFIQRRIEVLRASVLIVRGADGAIRAFHNVCTHRGTRLVEEESGRQASFRCPYHSWTFGHDGGLLSAPDFEAFDVTKAECALPPVAIEIVAGLIFVHLGTPTTTMRESLGPLSARLEALPIATATRYLEYRYEIDANWKLTYDNFQENYHLRFIHPRSGAGGIGPANPFGYPNAYEFFGQHRAQNLWIDRGPRSSGPVEAIGFRKIGEALMKRDLVGGAAENDYFALFPNFFMLASPGQMFTHTVYPVAVDRSRGVFRFYWAGDDMDASERFAREYAMAITRDIHAEDTPVIERGQQGLASGALTHIHLQTNEALVRHLFNCVDEMVQDYRAETQGGSAK